MTQCYYSGYQKRLSVFQLETENQKSGARPKTKIKAKRTQFPLGSQYHEIIYGRGDTLVEDRKQENARQVDLPNDCCSYAF